MAKKELEIKIKSETEEIKTSCIGIVSDGKIKYNDNDVLVVVTIQNDIVSMTRENEEYQLNLEFKNNKKTYGNYLLKGSNINLKLEIVTNRLKIDNNYVNITYILNDETREYTLNIKE